MKPTWIVAALVLLNLLSLGSNLILVSSFKAAGSGGSELAALRNERNQLAGERTRLEARVEHLREISERIEKGLLKDLGEENPPGPEPARLQDPAPREDTSPEAGAPYRRPDPLSMELLGDEDLRRIQDLRRGMPGELNDAILLQGDAETLLSDPSWNPLGRALGGDERAALDRLLKDYRYFSRLALEERFKMLVEPEIEPLRRAGAYVEYPDTEAPPRIEGAWITHAEPSEREGHWRLYYFFPGDYPELYHHRRVCDQRSLETFVEAYSLINGSAVPEERRQPGNR